MSLLGELKRRNVFKVGAAYLALAWLVLEVSTTVTPLLNLPDWLPRVLLWIGIIGFPFVLVFSWFYELTPEGLERETEAGRPMAASQTSARRLNYITIGLATLAIAFFAYDRFGPRPSAVPPDGGLPGTGSAETPLEQRPVFKAQARQITVFF